jgi:hypothetical protein
MALAHNEAVARGQRNILGVHVQAVIVKRNEDIRQGEVSAYVRGPIVGAAETEQPLAHLKRQLFKPGDFLIACHHFDSQIKMRV